MGDTLSDRQSDPTLYDPPDGEQRNVSEETEEEELRLEIPRELATHLMEVALHLGLTPSLVASRAIEMVCDEVGLVQESDLSSDALIEKYQTRLDLLHSLDYDLEQDEDTEESEESFSWDQVDEIIETGEEARR